ncbi:hypothetical protein [Desulfuromonas sp. AOP6]|uniref:hypothetical protein n=1 Tax=Desulfuromonas sp. AOP6 TaxID=1566351 RepID=UPI00128931EE|nr:hypothetical protein [Desulfuromonas sp. AOP6]BCA79985.1 hypothetical protein AOP6_1772 [Desulfuromonas sp. AOP6]
MKTMTSIAIAATILFGSASSVLAATGMREDNSGIIVWVFLGFCALIIVAQLLPAILLAVGMVKGLAGTTVKASQIN